MIGPEQTLEIKGVSQTSYTFDAGELKRNKGGDRITFFVNMPEKIIRRESFYRSPSGKNTRPLNTQKPIVYDIVYQGRDPFKKQFIVKAIGKTEDADGFETVVIGEDFIAISRAIEGYFEIYQFKRMDPAAAQPVYSAKKTQASQQATLVDTLKSIKFRKRTKG